MAKTRQQKEVELKKVKDLIENSKSFVFVNYEGLKVKDIEDLRKQFRAEKVDYVVAKKRIMRIALKEAEIDVDPTTFEHAVAVAFCSEDEVAPARIINQFSKDHESLQPIGGVLENKFVDKTQVIALANLPSKPELYAKIVGSINAPVSGFVNVLAGNIRNLLYVLSAVKEAKN